MEWDITGGFKKQISWQNGGKLSCYLPVSSQKTQTGGADFITEYHYLYAVTLVVGWSVNWGALLHHPPLVCLSLWRPSDLLEFDWHGPEENEVRAVRVLWGKMCQGYAEPTKFTATHQIVVPDRPETIPYPKWITQSYKMDSFGCSKYNAVVISMVNVQ